MHFLFREENLESARIFFFFFFQKYANQSDAGKA